MNDFYADTYAILAGLDGDPAYVSRLRSASFRTGWLNLYEAYYAQLARGVLPEEARWRLAPFEPAATNIAWSTLRAAAELRHRFLTEGRRCSYIDAAGYARARELGLPFLTGDPAFKGVAGVEFLPETRRGRHT